MAEKERRIWRRNFACELIVGDGIETPDPRLEQIPTKGTVLKAGEDGIRHVMILTPRDSPINAMIKHVDGGIMIAVTHRNDENTVAWTASAVGSYEGLLEAVVNAPDPEEEEGE